MPNENKSMADRTIVRSRGCWSCKHYEHGALARQHYAATTSVERQKRYVMLEMLEDASSDGDESALQVARQAGKLVREGTPPAAALEIALQGKSAVTKDRFRQAAQNEQRGRAFDVAVNAGAIGICLKGATKGDFVDCRYLCAQWVGVEGASVATEGQPLDKLPEELRAEMDGEDNE